MAAGGALGVSPRVDGGIVGAAARSGLGNVGGGLDGRAVVVVATGQAAGRLTVGGAAGSPAPAGGDGGWLSAGVTANVAAGSPPGPGPTTGRTARAAPSTADAATSAAQRAPARRQRGHGLGCSRAAWRPGRVA